MTLDGLKQYFENYAQKHVELKHNPHKDSEKSFFCVNMEDDADQYLRDAVMDLILVLMPYDKTLLGSGANNFNFNKKSAFLVVKRCEKSNESIIAAQSQCEKIADDFLSRLMADRHTLITGFDPETVAMEPVGPLLDNHYGYICMFTLIDGFEYWVNPDRWIS